MEELLYRAHRLYELEGDYLRSLLAKDATYAKLLSQMERLEARLAQKLGADTAAALHEARELLLAMTRETAFKMGYLYAHTYPLEEAAAKP
ncbi:hypothetical protein AAU61_04200 [Desulfocarbo indianensis]|nr:hypothetical protein AAU61_04200 [Desulfocarbo indianensis]